MVPEAIFTSNHAITIDAPREHVWPWIAQMGSGRAGWYSWDVIDNGGTRSSTSIEPGLQAIGCGDIMPTVPGATDAFVVAAVDPPRDLVLTVPDANGGVAVAWEHFLEPIAGSRTRLIVRGRASSGWLALAQAKPGADRQRIFIERAYSALARLPRRCSSRSRRWATGYRKRDISAAFSDAVASAETGRPSSDGARLLSCGILASILYVAMTLFVGLLGRLQRRLERPGVNWPPSALTRTLWILLGMVYGVLMIRLDGSSGPRRSNRALRVVGALLMRIRRSGNSGRQCTSAGALPPGAAHSRTRYTWSGRR
jgi:hypothetical protein